MFPFDRILANSPYATISKFVARFSCLLAFFYPANTLYLLNEDASTYDGVGSVIIGACFIVSAWWAGRLWARYRTIKYLAAQVLVLLIITFYLLTQLISIPRQWHGPIVIGYLIILWLLAVQRGGESRKVSPKPNGSETNSMFSLDRRLAISPYSTASKFLASFSYLLAFLYPANKLYLLNENVSMNDGVASVIIGMCFILSVWWARRSWARYRTLKYLVMQVLLFSYIVFIVLAQLIAIPYQLHLATVVVLLVALYIVAIQPGESRKVSPRPDGSEIPKPNGSGAHEGSE